MSQASEARDIQHPPVNVLRRHPQQANTCGQRSEVQVQKTSGQYGSRTTEANAQNMKKADQQISTPAQENQKSNGTKWLPNNDSPQDRARESQGQNLQRKSHEGLTMNNTQGKDKERLLSRKLADWVEEDYIYFKALINNASSPGEVRKALGNIRNDKLAEILLKVRGMKYDINMEKVAEWFVSGGDNRSRSPVVKVCAAKNGDYVRISRALAERFGLEFKIGQEYEFTVVEAEGKQIMQLVPLD